MIPKCPLNFQKIVIFYIIKATDSVRSWMGVAWENIEESSEQKNQFWYANNNKNLIKRNLFHWNFWKEGIRAQNQTKYFKTE